MMKKVFPLRSLFILFNAVVLSVLALVFPVFSFAASSSSVWLPTGSLTTARTDTTNVQAVVLQNGKVLVVGGLDTSGNTLSSSELYDPTTGVWTITGSLNTPRNSFTLTLLTNGEVLAAGGTNGNSLPLQSAELYNPTTGVWTLTGSLHMARDSHSAVLLQSGKVIVVGGVDSTGNQLSSAELYDPTNGTWVLSSGTLNQAREFATTTPLSNGTVLIAGGTNNGILATTLSSAELYNPNTDSFTATGSMHDQRTLFTATLLKNGTVLVVGGDDFANLGTLQATNSAELYNPTTGVWTMTGSMSTKRLWHTASLLSNGDVLVAGGTDASASNVNGDAFASAEIYNQNTGIWSVASSLTNARFSHGAVVLPDAQVLVFGGGAGISSPTVLSSSELFSMLSISPATASATVSTGAATMVSATVSTPSSVALASVPVTFTVVSGPNIGVSGTCSTNTTCTTDSNGNVTFTYVSNGQQGTDVISACVTLNQCVSATKTWIAHQIVPTDTDQCKDGGWKTFTNPSFKNQGQCIEYVHDHQKEVDKQGDYTHDMDGQDTHSEDRNNIK